MRKSAGNLNVGVVKGVTQWRRELQERRDQVVVRQRAEQSLDACDSGFQFMPGMCVIFK